MFIKVSKKRYASIKKNATHPYHPKQNFFRVLLKTQKFYLIDVPMGARYKLFMAGKTIYTSPHYSDKKHSNGEYMWIEHDYAELVDDGSKSNRDFASQLLDR